jgi:hypothetical protein
MTTTADPFDHRKLQRKDLMSLSKISANDEKIQRFKGGLNSERDYSYNLFNMDIIGKRIFLISFRKFSQKIWSFNTES